MEILIAILCFILLGGGCGLLLAVASKAFAVQVDERVERLVECLPGANCGGCGFSGCALYAQAVAAGQANIGCCTPGGNQTAAMMAAIMGTEAMPVEALRAQVMCSGTHDLSLRKYVYEGAPDCVAATRLGGGDRLCPAGCVGLGTCASVCKFGAIHVEGGVAVVDYHKCTGCGVCTRACPKHIIKLIPFGCHHWVGCSSPDPARTIRSYCDVGCITCQICVKNCPSDAIHIIGNVAVIDYAKCTNCGTCVKSAPATLSGARKCRVNTACSSPA